MKKKTLAALLVIPIVVSLLTYVSIQVLINQRAIDIDSISFSYRENEDFRISEGEVLLEATPVYDSTQLIREESYTLRWTCPEDQDIVEINERNGNYYLNPLSDGVVQITVSNLTGTRSRSFNAVVYEEGAIVINNNDVSSGESLHTLRRYGEYDLVYDESNTAIDSYRKVNASFGVTVQVLGDFSDKTYSVSDISDNITFDASSGTINILQGGDAYLTLSSNFTSSITRTYEFVVVDEGCNVRSYDDLLRCTNYSSQGEKAVLQINLGSLRDTYVSTTDADGNIHYTNELLTNNTKLFGHYDFETSSFSFEDEVYTFQSSYNTEFFDEYNANNGTMNDITDNLIAGLHVQKDLIGNGFTINMHELAFPTNGSLGMNGLINPGEGDLFKGPLPFVGLGDLSDLNSVFIEAFGQDNCGVLIDQDNVVIDDIEIANTNNQSNMYDFFFTGSVIDVSAENVSITNSVIQNGKNVIRAFSSDNLLIDNCILRNAGEFLLYLGNNENNKNSGRNVTVNGTEVSFSQFMDTPYDSSSGTGTGMADHLVTEALMEFGDATSHLPNFQLIQEALDNSEGFLDSEGNSLGTNVTVEDTFFYNSALFSIALDTLFNGGYLYNGMPTMVGSLLSSSAVPPENIGGTSKPVNLSLEGDCRFYDYKSVDSMDLSGIIMQNLSTLMQSQGVTANISIDDFFPIKQILKETLDDSAYYIDEEGEKYLCTDVIFYGGGLNLSTVTTNTEDEDFSDEISIDFASGILSGRYLPDFGDDSNADIMTLLVGVLSKAVLAVTGTHPFKAIFNSSQEGVPEYFDKAPSINELEVTR